MVNFIFITTRPNHLGNHNCIVSAVLNIFCDFAWYVELLT